MKTKFWSTVGLIIIALGLIVLIWPIYQYVLSQSQQQRLMDQFAEAASHTTVHPVQERERTPRPVGEREEPVDEGPFVLIIERLDLDVAIVEGIGDEDLARGPGLYPHSPMPGQAGNVAIAGHRNSHGAWFLNLHLLEAGDEIVIESPIGRYRYEVESTFVVSRDAWEVVEATEEPVLTLTTCHPIGSVQQRLIARADFVGFESNP